MSPDRLIYMANQIGKFFHSQGHDKAVPGIADHIKKFWDPRMRKAIFAHLELCGWRLEHRVKPTLASERYIAPAGAAERAWSAVRASPMVIRSRSAVWPCASGA